MFRSFAPALPLALALAAAGAAHAQTGTPAGVTLYGLIDTGVEYVGNVGASGHGDWAMPTLTASVPSRWGLRGSEDLGGGLRASFTLESGFAPSQGTLNQGGRIFGRQAFVALEGPWGSLSLGRQYTMLFWSLAQADILGPNVHGLGSLDSYVPNARADQALAWRGTFGGLTAGVTYSFGRDAVNAGPSPGGTNCAGINAADQKECREWSALLKYDTAGWGVAAAVDELRGGPGAFAGLVSSDLKDRRISLNGYATFGATKVGLGLLRRDNDANPATPRSNLWYVGASHPLTPSLTLDGQLYRYTVRDSDNRATLLAARLTYALSKRTALYASLARVSNDGQLAMPVSGGIGGRNPPPGGGQNGAMLGVRHAF